MKCSFCGLHISFIFSLCDLFDCIVVCVADFDERVSGVWTFVQATPFSIVAMVYFPSFVISLKTILSCTPRRRSPCSLS